MLHELTTKEKYVLPQPKTDDKGNNKPEVATLEEITEEEEEEEEEESEENSKEEDGNQECVKTKDEDAGNDLFNFFSWRPKVNSYANAKVKC